jgi:multiple sugar transport system substrate-binding protein
MFKRYLLKRLLVIGFLLTFFLSSSLAFGAEKVTITWLMRSNPVENKWQKEYVIPKFEASHPNISINLIIVPFNQMDQKLLTMVAAGEPPDVFSQWGISGFGDYYARGLLLDLTPYIERDRYNLGAFIPRVINIYKRSGKYYSVPQVTNYGIMMYYNKDLFDKAGLPYPPVSWKDKSWTWDKMLDYAKKLTKNYGEGVNAQYGIDCSYFQGAIWGAAYLWGDDPFLPEHYKTGLAKSSKLDSPGVIEAVQAVADLIYKHKVAPTPAISQVLSQLGPLFGTGKIGMSFGLPTQAYTNYQNAPFKWGLAPMPYVKDNKVAWFNGTWFIAKNSKHPEEAWEFLKFLTSEEAARDMAKVTGFLVPLKRVVNDWYKLFEKPTGMKSDQIKTVVEGVLANGVENVNHLFISWPEINDILTQELSQIWLGKVSASEGLKSAKPKVDEVILKIYKQFSGK